MSNTLGPLTTTFTPPASCLNFNTFYRDYNVDAVKLLDAPECYPSSYVSTGFYSPGLICPSGYNGYTNNDGSETTVNCCPNQFIFSGPWPGPCVTTESSSTLEVYVTDLPSNSASSATSTQYYPPPVGPLIASAIQLRYQASDLASSTTSPSSQASASATSGTTSAAASSTSASGHSDAGTSSGLSTGAKIGIGVAVPVIVLFLVALLAVLFLRRRKQKRAVAGGGLDSRPADEQLAFMHHDKDLRHELSTERAPAELEAHGK